MIEANRIKLGFFIGISLLLIVICLFYVGLDEFFAPHLKVLTVFQGSVEGLKKGSPVKFKGVPLGRVDRISLLQPDGRIAVYITIYSSSIDSISKTTHEIETVDDSGTLKLFVEALKQDGICCSLQSAGVTGGAFLELENLSKQTNVTAAEVFSIDTVPEGYIYVPSRSSHIASVIENISRTAEQLAKIDFVALNSDLKDTINNLNKVMQKVETSKVLGTINKTCEQINTSLISLSNTEKKQIIPVLEELKTCLSAVTQIAENGNTKINDLDIMRNRLLKTLSKINQTMEHISSLANNIDEDPASLVRGKSKPVIIKK